MTVFPIHIIELLTLALILLGAYRVFHAQSLELDAKPQEHAPCVSTKEFIPEYTSALEHNRANHDEKRNRTPEKSQKLEMPAVSHQSVLDNYIGDFF